MGEQELHMPLPSVQDLTKSSKSGSITFPLMMLSDSCRVWSGSCSFHMCRVGSGMALNMKFNLLSLSGSSDCSVCLPTIFLKDD